MGRTRRSPAAQLIVAAEREYVAQLAMVERLEATLSDGVESSGDRMRGLTQRAAAILDEARDDAGDLVRPEDADAVQWLEDDLGAGHLSDLAEIARDLGEIAGQIRRKIADLALVPRG